MAAGLLSAVLLMCSAAAGALTQNQAGGLGSCKDYGETFDRVFVMPREAALLNCTLVNPGVFDVRNVPYNITWYNQSSGLELDVGGGGGGGSVMTEGTRLWFLSSSPDQQGSYLCVVRTAEACYKQATVVQMDEAVSEGCSQPHKAVQPLQLSTSDMLACPLSDYSRAVEHFSVQWFKGCELLQDSWRMRQDQLELLVYDVLPEDAGFYTCSMNFTFNGEQGHVSKTIEAAVEDEFSRRPDMIEPAQEFVKAALGSELRKMCRVFVRGDEIPMVLVIWVFQEEYVSQNTSHRIHQGDDLEYSVDEGYWLERELLVSPVREEDYDLNFSCVAFSAHGAPSSYFTLRPADADLLLPVVLVLLLVALLLILGMSLYRAFKVELALAFRTSFPIFYESADSDGKLYDAYVVYPRLSGDSASDTVEAFAVKTLPQVLEGEHGYRLFVMGRDALPGQAVVDAAEEAMSRCRRLLLLYTAAALRGPDWTSWVEQQSGLHRALVEGSIRVVLLEMEQLGKDCALPESLQLIRDRQGVLRAWERRWRWWWWRRGGGGGMERDEEEEVGKSLTSLHLTARFWRELRYHMPIRGKAKPHARGKVLLSL